MAKFNVKGNRRITKPVSPITTLTPDTRTYQGAVGWSRDPKSELFLLGVANMVSEDSFYEKAIKRDQRFEDLVTQVAVTDPGWLKGFFPWLRHEANMRSAPVVGAAIAAKSMLANKIPGSRQIIAGSLGRADEPGEFLSYWISRWGDKLPMPVKRGVADAVVRLYNQRSLLKYDTRDVGLRFSNVIQLVHPTPQTTEQRELFKFAMERVYKDSVEMPNVLRTVARENEFRKEIADGSTFAWDHFFAMDNHSDLIRGAGLTWEDVIPRVPAQFKGQAWQALIPTMGYMALLRNLRNFDEDGVDRVVKAQVANRIADPQQVARSKQFPFRFLTAYRNLGSLTWGPALEEALNHSLANVPELSGRTLVLVDRSGSMFTTLSATQNRSWRSSFAGVTMAEVAAIFGAALALRNAADLVEFGSTSKAVTFRPGDSLLRTVTQSFSRDLGGTYLAQATRAHFRGHDRVVVITDEQYHDGAAGSVVPAQVPVYTFNLAGFKPAGDVSGAGNRHTFGGLTDVSFKLIPMLEAAASGRWPWEIGE